MTMTRLAALPALLTLAFISSASPAGAQDAMRGELYDVAGSAITFEEVAKRAAEKDFVLIGEIHLAEPHHRMQADLVTALAAGERRPAVVLEMLPPSAQQSLDDWIDGSVPADALGATLGWEERGWPDFDFYLPIFEAAREAGLPMIAGGIEREETMAIARGGDVTARRSDELMLDRPLGAEAQALLTGIIVDSHCGMVDAAAASPMVDVQRARDGAMARAMLDAGSGGAILIAGTGHVTRDHGVPRLLPEGSSYVVGQIEAAALPDDRDAYDAIHVTPPVERADPCEAMRAMMENREGGAPAAGHEGAR